MAITQSGYQLICERLQYLPINAALKQYFQHEINSPRRMTSINTIGDLICVLEKRDLLGPDNNEHLQYITCVTNNMSLWYNVLTSQSATSQTDFSFNRSFGVEPRVIPPTPRDPIKRLNRLIVQKIGSNWKNLARELDIPEGWIDRLQETYPFDFDKRVYEVLQYHWDSSPQNQWRNKLQCALREARRLDLSNEVGEILSQAGIS